jgi:GNAT superfamily N-acetyltransferase
MPAFLLARLAVDRDHERAGLGRSLLQDVMLRCLDAAEAIGARVLLVHAQHEAAKAASASRGRPTGAGVSDDRLVVGSAVPRRVGVLSFSAGLAGEGHFGIAGPVPEDALGRP